MDGQTDHLQGPMTVRHFVAEKDYPVIAEWWKAWEWPVLPPSLVPLNDGLVIHDAEQDLAMGFLYYTDTAFTWMEWITGNPDANKFQRRDALDILIRELTIKAKENGSEAIFTSMKHPGLIERMQKHGFLVSDEGMTNLVKRI